MKQDLKIKGQMLQFTEKQLKLIVSIMNELFQCGVLWLLVGIFCIKIFPVDCWSANLSVKEEFQPNQAIGNIKSNLPENIKALQLKFSSDSQFLHVKNNGDVILKKKIDLETLCQMSKICCGQLLCFIQTNIFVNDNNEFLGSLILNVQIEDLNDNTPRFSKSERIIALRESLPVNSSISLESAIDNDFSPENRILHYKLEDPSNKFELDSLKFPQISLRLKSELDYEVRKQYPLILKACDKDTCTDKELSIEVVDENDNKPQFTQKFYRISILENTETGTLVLTVNANDFDSGDLGKITYSIEAPLDPDLLQTFGIDSRSGQIRLERPLATNIRKLYTFYVVAKDNDLNNPQKDKVTVEISVVDINNFTPMISMLTNERVEIRENSPPTILCTIKVTDDDIGINSKVSCRLSQDSIGDFQIIKKSESLYSLASNRSFDFERGQLKSASINCSDSGKPPKSADRLILVHIIDVNEYEPVFIQQVYEVSVRENSATNKLFLRLNATDRDGSALLRYSLDQKGLKYFKIDSSSGWIKTTNVLLDREKIETIVFNVYVSDAVVDPFTAKTKVIVTIEDENDNAPIFGVIPEFSILENSLGTRLQGQLTATDADKGVNRQLEFVLIKTWALKQELHKIFHVTEDGYIETLQTLDRETFETYTLEVGVHDKGQHPLATSINITVSVLDVNDNKPQWIYPNPINSEHNITRTLNKNDVIMRVKAFDTDAGENGRVVYSFYNSNVNAKQSIFTLDENSGEIRLIKEMDVDRIELSLVASDCGTKPKTSLLKIVINNHDRSRSTINVRVIIALISVTGFISIVLVVSIICVRKRPMSAGVKYSCPNNIDLSKTNMAEWTFQDNSIYKQKPSVQIRNDIHMPHHVASSRTSYEPIDAEESGDSGKGPSEDIRNGLYVDQNQIFARNYANLQWKIPSPIPSTACNGRQLYMLPDRSMTLLSENNGSPYPTLLVSNPNDVLNYNINKQINGMVGTSLGYLNLNPPNANEFSLPRSPDYYQTSNPQSQIYETPDSFNSEFDICQIQQSNI